MTLRFALGLLLCASFARATPATVSAPTKPKPISERTWQALTDHVMKNGIEWPIKAPACRTLGYDSDSVAAKALRIKSSKSKDGQEHSVFIVYDSTGTGGISHPREMVLGSIRIREANSGKEIKSYRLRLKLDGHPISAMRAEGVVGKVKQRALSVESAEVKELLAIERKLFLRDIELNQLTE